MKKIFYFLLAIILAFFLENENLVACHEEAAGGDFGIWPSLKGHSPASRQSGVFVTFEGTSASISTSTNCNAYSHFIELNYDQIASDAAQGQGPYLDALATLNGCSDESKLIFGRVIHDNFSKLFKYNGLKIEMLNHSLEIILDREPLLLNECQNRPRSIFS